MPYTVTPNSPAAGSISWTDVHIVYSGVDYPIANGNTTQRFVWWRQSTPGAFLFSDTHPSLGPDDAIVFLNKTGVPISVLNATAMEGDLVVPGTVTATSLAVDSVTADKIQTDAIIGRHILAGSIVAEKLAVTQLSAISANMGTMTAGNITLNATGFIRGGATNFGSGNGVWMGYDVGAYKFRAGAPGSSRMEWNGSAFNIYGPDGNITISSGVVDYARTANKPASLGDINTTEGSKLSGVAAGATRNVFRGDWATSLVYSVGDIVLNGGYGWSSLTNHTSSASVRPPVWPTPSNADWVVYTIKGDTGAPGVNGTRTAVLDMYRNSPAAPTTFPSGSSTYTWATGQFTAPATPNSWSVTPPAPAPGEDLWVVRQLYSDNQTTTTSSVGWAATTSRISAASGEAGVDGINGSRVGFLEVYQWSFSDPATFPAGTSTYTWATGAFTPPTTPNGWSLLPGATTPGQTLWACSVRVANNLTTTTSPVTWNSNVVYAVGSSGLNGVDAKVVFLTGTSQVFLIPKTGAAVPSSITLTAYGQNVTGSPVFSITSGTATLTGSGNSRAVAFASMTTDSVTVRAVWDGQEDFFTLNKVREGTDGVDGPVGADGLNGLTVVVTNESHTVPASTTGAVSSYLGSGTQIQVYEGGVALSASGTATTSAFRIGTIAQAPASTLTVGAVTYATATATVANHSAMAAGTDSVVLTIPVTIYRANGTSVTVSKVQTITKSKAGTAGAVGAVGATGAPGVSPVLAILSNEVHTFPASSAGAVSSYTGSGTQIRVYEGATELDYDGVGTANGKWTVSSAGVNIARGTLTDSGLFLTVGDHAGVASGTDTSQISYTVTGKTAAGAAFSIVKQQTFSKSKAGATGTTGATGATGTAGAVGATGSAGPAVNLVSNLPATFVATDGTLNAGQANIVFTATTQGLVSPSFVWTFSGLQTNPTASTTATQTITSAQFGTAKSAIVTVTVNGSIVDKMTIVRLEKSTAAAGATVGANIGTNLTGQITSDNASTYIANAAIGSAQIGSIALVGTSNFSVKSGVSGQRMEMDSRTIKIFDTYGVLRVQLGDLTA